MEELGSATEDEVVLAFLKAEIHSPTYGERYDAALQACGLSRTIIDFADSTNAMQNRQRAAVLGMIRGYPGRLLFRGFPRDVAWRRVRLQPNELGLLKYGRMDEWIGVAGNRSVAAAGRKVLDVATDTAVKVMGVVAKITAGKTFPPLIVVEGAAGDLILIEGYTRATGYAAAQVDFPIEALVGKSPEMDQWHWY